MVKEFRETCPTCGQLVRLRYHCPVTEDHLVLDDHKAWSSAAHKFVPCAGSGAIAEEEAAHA